MNENLNLTYLSARKILLQSTRFDLMSKFLYAEHYYNSGGPSLFLTDLYLRNIHAFNGYYEIMPAKRNANDFLDAFNETISSIRLLGYVESLGIIHLDEQGNPVNGAHRLAAAAALNIDVPTRRSTTEAPNWDWKFFLRHGLSANDADFTAMSWVQSSKFATVILVHSCVQSNLLPQIEAIMQRRLRVYYNRKLKIDHNSYINLKKICYIRDYSQKSWAGGPEDGFIGARRHADGSFGTNPLNVYVVAGLEHEILEIKNEVRQLVGKGNYSIHSSETHDEACELVEALFNENSRQMMSTVDAFSHNEAAIHANQTVRDFTDRHQLKRGSLIITGSGPMALIGSRVPKDIDVLSNTPLPADAVADGIHDHSSQMRYYQSSTSEILDNPTLHMWFRGVKYLSLEALMKFKRNRSEFPKDIVDLRDLEKVFAIHVGYGGLRKRFYENVYTRIASIRFRLRSKARTVKRLLTRSNS
jgi:hypothetical protein